MKLTIIIMTVFLMQVSALTKAQITLNEKGTSLQKVLEQISTQSGYDLVYSSLDFKNAKPVTIKLNDVSLNKALEAAFEGQPLIYEVTDKTVMIRKKAEKSYLENVIARFLAIDVRGKILNESGEPLSGATISVKGKNQSTKSNSEGSFYLPNVDENATLQISFIGYITREIPAKEDLGSIQLQLGNNDLQEVIINKGYYKENKLTSTGNVGSISEKDIDQQNVNNPILALQGRIPGVDISQVNGIAGGTVKINIRGVNTLFQATDPLFVIDGVPYLSNMFQSPGYQGLFGISGGQGLNPLSLINPKDIESIDVLKDADATAIYGSRGANGVVLITTKKGKAGATNIDINFQKGFGNVTRKADLLNTPQYLQMRKEAFFNDQVTPNINNAKDLLEWDQNAYTDWQKIMVGGTADYTTAQASISGGSNATQFLVGANYSRETTVFPGDYHDEKASVHFNVNNITANQKFKTSLSGSFLADNNLMPTIDFTQFITIAPNAPKLYNENGKLNWKDFPSNPFASLVRRYTAKSQNLVSNAVLSYNILPFLEIKTNLGFNSVLLNEKTRNPIAANNPANRVTTGGAVFNTNVLRSWIIEPQVNFKTNLRGGVFSLLIGATSQQRLIDGQGIIGIGYTDDGLLGSLAGAQSLIKGQSIYEEYKYSSFFSRLNYNWKNKYQLNLTARRDGSSRFGPGRQYGNFGAIGAAWIFTEETFFQRWLPSLTYGKLRGSYGTVGNEPSTNYAFVELYNFGSSFPYGNGSGIIPTGLPTPDFRWEVSKKAEVGLELGLFQDRLTFIGSIYRNISSNQLINKPLPASVGFSGILSNLPATIQNKGVEFTVNSINVKSEFFQWTSGFNISVTRNKLASFPNIETSGYRDVFTVGQPVNGRRVFRGAGVDANTGLYQFFDKDGKITSTPVSPADANVVLNVLPKFSGGFQNSFTYKNLSLDINFQFVNQLGKNYLFSSVPPGFFQNHDGKANQPVVVQDRWNQNNKQSNFQRYFQGADGSNSYSFAQNSDLSFSNASYLRLKNIALSYQLPVKIQKKFNLKNCRVYFQGQNLLTFTKYKGADPETQNLNVLPPLRVVTAGLQITL